jgi:hypothetical protein
VGQINSHGSLLGQTFTYKRATDEILTMIGLA